MFIPKHFVDIMKTIIYTEHISKYGEHFCEIITEIIKLGEQMMKLNLWFETWAGKTDKTSFNRRIRGIKKMRMRNRYSRKNANQWMNKYRKNF